MTNTILNYLSIHFLIKEGALINSFSPLFELNQYVFVSKTMESQIIIPKIPHFFIPTRRNTVNTGKISDYSEPWGILNGEPQITQITQITQIKND